MGTGERAGGERGLSAAADQTSSRSAVFQVTTPEELEQLLAGGPLPRLRERLTDLAESLRYEESGSSSATASMLSRTSSSGSAGSNDSRPKHLPDRTPPHPRLAEGILRSRRRNCAIAPSRRAGARLEINAGLAIARITPPQRGP